MIFDEEQTKTMCSKCGGGIAGGIEGSWVITEDGIGKVVCYKCYSMKLNKNYDDGGETKAPKMLNGCEAIECRYYDHLSKRCTDEEEFVHFATGEEVCRRHKRAVAKGYVLNLQQENAKLKKRISNMEQEIANFLGILTIDQ